LHDYIFLGKENEKISYDLESLKGKKYKLKKDYLINLDDHFFDDNKVKIKKNKQTNIIADCISNNFNNRDEIGNMNLIKLNYFLTLKTLESADSSSKNKANRYNVFRVKYAFKFLL